jgi:hypothetical protein
MIKSLAFVASLAFAAAPAAAMADGPAKKDKLVCKRIEGTGWRLSNSNKVCKTAAEWAAISEANQKDYRDYNRGGSQGTFGDGVGGRSTTGN